MKIRLIGAPSTYAGWLETEVSLQLCPAGAIPDWVHVFAVSGRDFEREMKALAPVWRKNRTVVIWVSWYKKSSGERPI